MVQAIGMTVGERAVQLGRERRVGEVELDNGEELANEDGYFHIKELSKLVVYLQR